MIKESNWNDSDQAYVPVDGKVFQILRSQKRYKTLFEAAGFTILKICSRKKDDDSYY